MFARLTCVIGGLVAFCTSRLVLPLYQTQPRILLESASLLLPPNLAKVALSAAVAFTSLWLLETLLYRRRLGLAWTDALRRSLHGYESFALLLPFFALFVPGIPFVPMIAWWLLLDGGWWFFSLTLLAAVTVKVTALAKENPLGQRLNGASHQRFATLGYAVGLLALIIACTPARRLTEPYDARWGTGDEPRYVRIAASLLHDGDADIGNAEERIGAPLDLSRSLAGFVGWVPAIFRSGWEATRGLLGLERPRSPRHLGGPVVEGSHGGTFYVFLPGFPLLLLPAMALDSLIDPARLTATLLSSMLLGVVCVLLMSRLVEIFVGSRWTGFGLSFLMGVTLPLFFFHFQLYSEVTAAICVGVIFLTLLAPHMTPWRALAFGLSCGYLPWLHTKYLPIWGVCLLAFAYRAFRDELRWRTRIPGLALAGLGMGLQCLYIFHITGSIMPDALWIARGYPRDANIVNRETLSGLYYLLLGRSEGLLVYAPLYLFVLPGILALRRKSTFAFLLTLAVVIPYLLAAASHDRGGAGAWSPPSRYIVPLLPALALCLAAWLQCERHRGIRWAACVIAAAGSFWTAQAMLDGRAFPYDRALFLGSRLVDPSPVLGSLLAGDALPHVVVYPLFLALVLVGLLLWQRGDWPFTPARLLATTLALILALGATAHAWSQSEDWIRPKRLWGIHRITDGQPTFLQLPNCGERGALLRIQATATPQAITLAGYGLKRQLSVASGPPTAIDVAVEPVHRYGSDPHSPLHILWLELEDGDPPVDVEAVCR